METLNWVKELNFSGPHIGARFVSCARDYYIGTRSIVVNPTRTDIVVDALRANVIPPFSSVILQDVYIASAASLIALELRDLTNLGDVVCEPGWALYGALVTDAGPPPDSSARPFPVNTPLWRSPQDDIGYIAFDPGTLPGQVAGCHGEVRFLVKSNLWFAPANTNCFIHNQHPFIEIHSQITGYGRMQKFRAQDYTTLYHDEMMSPGCTTVVPFCDVVARDRYVYPWHQYYADDDCIWMAVEYRPAT